MWITRATDGTETLGGFCRLCMQAVCETCEKAGKCVPFEKRLELMERRDAFGRAFDAMRGT